MSAAWLSAGISLLIVAAPVGGQQGGAKPPAKPTVEAGLEQAVKWKWRVEASNEADWGLKLEVAVSMTTGDGKSKDSGRQSAGRSGSVPVTGPPETSLEHEVSKGEALVIIARRYGVTVEQLMIANELTGDLILIGQKLNIPSRAEVVAMRLQPPPEEGGAKSEATEDRPVVITPKYSRPLNESAKRAMAVAAKQAFLDRKLYSSGPIDGMIGSMFRSALAAYEEVSPKELTWERGLTPPSILAIGGAYQEYFLREEDFRWINTAHSEGRSGRSRSSALTEDPDPTWEELTGGTFLPYRSAWEFVAERFHCAEGFLRRINSVVKTTPKAGTMFLVPNVEPFVIEKAFEEPVRPEVDAAMPVTAKIVGNAWLEVWQGELMKARVPVAAARPGLRGRGTWWILDSVARPRLVGTGELVNPPKATAVGVPGEDASLRQTSLLGAVLPPGPNNPIGLFWINLAKGRDETPLPYGLHGTSIPGHMSRLESLGGFQLANWDLVRVIRLLPVGTELKWE